MNSRSSKSFVLFAGDAGWRVGAVSSGVSPVIHDVAAPNGDSTEAITLAVSQTLDRLGYKGQGIPLAVPSYWCLCAALPLPTTPRKRRRQSLLFQLEESLPMAVEDVAADFIERDDGVLGVCLPEKRVRPVVEALESAGVRIEVICPAALLALQGLLDSGRAPDCDVCLWGDGRSVDLFRIKNGFLDLWFVVPQQPTALSLHLGRLANINAGTLRVWAIGVPEPLLEVVGRTEGVIVVALDPTPLLSEATSASGRILTGKMLPWIDLRRDALAPSDAFRRFRRPLTAAVVAVVLFLACASAALFWRANRFQELTRQYEDDQRAAFRQTFPAVAMPATPRSRLASEERRLSAAGGAGGPQSPSALPALYEMLARLPEEARFRVAELSLSDGRVTLKGQARSHADAEAVAAALRSRGGFRVEPPRSEQSRAVPGGVNFDLVGVFTGTSTLAADGAAIRPATAPASSNPEEDPDPDEGIDPGEAMDKDKAPNTKPSEARTKTGRPQ